jgi:hypothetical protein
MENLVETLCISFATFFNLKVREIYRRDNNKYLTRYYIFRKPFKWMPSIYLHCFHSSDEDLELHNHDWHRSISFILSGSYLEERFGSNNKIITRILKPGNFNYIKDKDFHRVELKTKRVWTLFISGSKAKGNGWGFLDRDTLNYVPWQEHVGSRQLNS